MGDQTMGATQFVAFLRAVNVGGRVVKMTELKSIFQKLGLDDVNTFIASGNVIFSASGVLSSLETKIEHGLEKSLKYAVPTMLRTTGEVARIAAYKAFSASALEGASLYVGFMKREASLPAVKAARSLQTDIDELHVHGREVFWLARKSIAEASITGAGVERALQTPVTFRNINTVRRLSAKYPVRQES
ncbi:MAG TPA: DUF1697 domain-containing protein [Vicinamibacterales bacterium]|nr:DUF1697 domain-containing protein [Vicinamibacterales bacterium]